MELYGRDGLPVISHEASTCRAGTSQNVLQAVARHISAAQAGAAQPQPAAGTVLPGRQDDLHWAPYCALGGFKVLEIAITAGPPAVGRKLGDITWPPGCVPVSVQDVRAMACGCRLEAPPNWPIGAGIARGRCARVQCYVREVFATLGIASRSQLGHVLQQRRPPPASGAPALQAGRAGPGRQRR